jgi:hypothetical protein
VNDLVDAARHVPGSDVAEDLLAQAHDRLVRPLLLAVRPIAPTMSAVSGHIAAALDPQSTMIVDHRATGPGDEVVAGADVLVLIGDAATTPAEVDRWSAALKAVRTGPVAVVVVLDGPSDTVAPVLTALRQAPGGSSVALALRWEHATEELLDALVGELSGARLSLLQGSAAIHPLVQGLDRMPPSPMRASVHEQVEGLRTDVPALEEVDLLRDLAASRVVVPPWLRGALHALLLHADAARRLGLSSGATPTELRERVVALGTEWRTHENSGRLPFTARRAALIAQRSLDLLHAELAPYG